MRAFLLIMALGLFDHASSAQVPDLPDRDRRTPIVEVVEKVGPAVVNLRTLEERRARRGGLFDRFARLDSDPTVPRGFANRSMGSGVIFHPSGWVITNNHVVRGADRIVAKLQDGRQVTARLISTSPTSDLAVLKLEGDGPYPSAVLGSSTEAMVGETTIAMGNPFGLSNSVTSGILSAKDRPLEIGRDFVLQTLQTSALINPGNSGGPLTDINGRVIGINVAVDRRGPGIGYAIPVDTVKSVVSELLSPEFTKDARLGLRFKVDGDRIRTETIDPGGPAELAGLRAGVEVLGIDGKPFATPLDFFVALNGYEPGENVPLTVREGGRTKGVELALEPLPLEALLGRQGQVWGMTLAELTPRARKRLDMPEDLSGVLVTGVKDDSSAARIGVRDGDVLIEVGRYGTPTYRALSQAVSRARFARAVYLKIYRPTVDGGRWLEGNIEPSRASEASGRGRRGF